MPTNLTNINNYIEKFNYNIENPDWNIEQENYMNNWITYFAIALIDDFGKPLMKSVSKIILAICSED